VLCFAVGLSLEYRKLCTELTDVQPFRMVHTDRCLFVGDWSSNSILVYSLERDLAFVRAIGSAGNSAGQFERPMGMCVYRDKLIVCDSHDRLQFIDISAVDPNDWRFDAPFGSFGVGAGQFVWPSDLCVAGGVVFVAESSFSSNRVQTFTIAVDPVTRALTLTHRSVIGGFDCPRALPMRTASLCSPILCAFPNPSPNACTPFPAHKHHKTEKIIMLSNTLCRIASLRFASCMCDAAAGVPLWLSLSLSVLTGPWGLLTAVLSSLSPCVVSGGSSADL
jgi:hypothetical protein